MAIIQYPDNLFMAKQSWGRQRTGVTPSSVFGASQTMEVARPIWTMSITPPPYNDSEFGEFKALILSLEGRQNLLACHDMRRPVPLGTMRGTMTVYADVAAGAKTMQIIAADQAGKTLLKGDVLGLGTDSSQQLIILTADAAGDESGIITVNFTNSLRNAFSAGSAITWNKPKALFRRMESDDDWEYANVIVSAQAVSFQEDWRV